VSEVVLTVNDRRYAGWQEVRVQRGMEQASGRFALTLTERWSGQDEPWPIDPGDRCALSIDGTVVITGYVDDDLPRYDERDHRISVNGRDAAGDLVDCSAANTPGRWENQTLLQIATVICKPFGIPVTVAAGTDTGARFRTFSLQPGETAFDAIERLCRYRGVLPMSDSLGGLVITGPGTARVPVRLVQGENILRAAAVRSHRERYNTYIVKGMDIGFGDAGTPEQNASPMGSAADPGVIRHRPLILISESAGDTAALRKRALWEAAVRRGRSTRAAVAVQGWSHPGGLWRPNTLVRVTSEWLRIDGDMLIAAVLLSKGDSGTLAELELCPPEGLKPITIKEEAGSFAFPGAAG